MAVFVQKNKYKHLFDSFEKHYAALYGVSDLINATVENAWFGYLIIVQLVFQNCHADSIRVASRNEDQIIEYDVSAKNDLFSCQNMDLQRGLLETCDLPHF